jgi:hypothetical protein
LLRNDTVNTFPQQPNHVITVSYRNATIEQLWEAVFSMQSTPRLCTGDRNGATERERAVEIEVITQASSTSQWWTDTARRQTVASDCGHEELRK